MEVKDRQILLRSRAQATQLYQKREQMWHEGADLKSSLTLERQLFAHLSLLSDFAFDVFSDDWPQSREMENIALLACLQSKDAEVFDFGLIRLSEKLSRSTHIQDDLSVLFLATSHHIPLELVDRIIESPLADYIDEFFLDQCPWHEDTIQYIATNINVSVPAWVDSQENSYKSPVVQLKQKLILHPQEAVQPLRLFLQQQADDCPIWQWLTLFLSDSAIDLFYVHARRFPEHMIASVFNSSGYAIEKLSACFQVPELAQQAAWAMEQMLAQPIEWVPAMVDVNSGASYNSGSKTPKLPTHMCALGDDIIQGQPKTPVAFASWLLNQPQAVQLVGWLHLSQLCKTVLPDYSRQWSHRQIQLLNIRLQNKRDSHAA